MITIYTKTDCPKCRMVKMVLDKEAIAYKTINIETNTKAMNKLLNHGFQALPVTVGDGMPPEDYIVGFQPDRLKALCR